MVQDHRVGLSLTSNPGTPDAKRQIKPDDENFIDEMYEESKELEQDTF